MSPTFLRKFVLLCVALALPIGRAEPTLPNMVLIPAGQLNPFWIRPKKQTEKPAPIQVQSFRIMKFPVTNLEYIEFLRRTPEWRKEKALRVFADQHYLSQLNSEGILKQSNQLKAPVTYISWFAARDYCESLGMRLPTLSEWEYVASANEVKADATKDAAFLSEILTWYSQPENKDGLAPVGKKKPNYFGVQDLHGLVWEWVDDFNSNLITGESRSDGGLDKNLFCGAGGMSGADKENYAAFMRFAFRSALKGASTTWNLGFRCVKEVSH